MEDVSPEAGSVLPRLDKKKIEFLKPATCVSGVKDFARGFQFYAIFRWSSYANSTGELKKISSLL